MKKKKNVNNINIKIMPLPLRNLNITNITKIINNNNKNKNSKSLDNKINSKNRIKSSTIKINKNIYKSNHSLKRLNTFNLIDKKIDIIYDWNILLNSKSPGIYYNKDAYKKLSINR